MSMLTAKHVQKILLAYDGIGHHFEVDSLTFGFPEIAETYEFWDFSREKVTLGFRFFCAFNSRYLRQSPPAGAVGRMRDVLNAKKPVFVFIEGINMTSTKCIIEPASNQISVQRQRLVKNYDFTATAVDKVDEIPSWFIVEAEKPGYLVP